MTQRIGHLDKAELLIVRVDGSMLTWSYRVTVSGLVRYRVSRNDATCRRR